jgi:hypothetical protein
MIITERRLRNVIRGVLLETRHASKSSTIQRPLSEVDVEDVENICYTAGSTHVMKTCKIGGQKYFLKFSDEDLFDDVDPSLQVLVEYLAYRIYGLYAGIKIPKVELVYDRSRRQVGIATTPAPGKQALVVGYSPKGLAKKLSQGVYVDIFLANWDVIGTGSGNVFVDPTGATRIDPGGALTFRAQGGRKGRAFSKRAGELETMLDPDTGAGSVFRHSDLKVAAQEFLGVPWAQVDAEISAVGKEVAGELESKDMEELFRQWSADVRDIRQILKARHLEITEHARMVLKG